MAKLQSAILYCASVVLMGQKSLGTEVSSDFFPFLSEATGVDSSSSNIVGDIVEGDSNSNATLIIPSDGECPLDCLNGGICQRGNQDLEGHVSQTFGVSLSFHKELNRNGWYCECPDGYTGLVCQAIYHTCTDGLHVCYHGGTCKTGDTETTDFFGTGESHCDCATATDSNNSLIVYSGTYCEDAFTDVEACKNENVCQNGGICQEDALYPCLCPEGYDGRYCDEVIETVPLCEKNCLNGGECMLIDGEGSDEYCSCPESQYGEFCEKDSQPCGDNYCHNGGECFQITLSDGKIEHLCDCTAGYTNEHYYSGEFCQYPSTVFCSDEDDINGRQFCTNGGECPEAPHQACSCPQGFSGPRCAFADGIDGFDYAECQLPCMNGGTCQKGVKDLDQMYGKFADDLADMYNQTHLDYEHCVCPSGFFGIRCEYKVQECETEGHVCLHGSTCEEGSGKSVCNCEDADHLTAGLYCEFFATEECEDIPTLDNRGFCTNGGLCTVADGALSCSCADGFSGPHCEYTTDDMTVPVVPQSTKETTSHGLSKDWRITIVISVVGLVGATVWYIVFSPRGRCARQRPTKSASWEPENLAAGEESDSDASTRVRRNAGNGLSSVDII